jgi:roadblock/LC7 domain-containing protein
VLVLGAEAAAPFSLKRAKRRLRAAAGQLTRDGKLVGKLADKDRLPANCADALTAAITRALERTNSLMTNLTACAS